MTVISRQSRSPRYRLRTCASQSGGDAGPRLGTAPAAAGAPAPAGVPAAAVVPAPLGGAVRPAGGGPDGLIQHRAGVALRRTARLLEQVDFPCHPAHPDRQTHPAGHGHGEPYVLGGVRIGGAWVWVDRVRGDRVRGDRTVRGDRVRGNILRLRHGRAVGQSFIGIWRYGWHDIPPSVT